ncbi:MAG: permease-like cell division protein FtsX [Edaphocola sp.]
MKNSASNIYSVIGISLVLFLLGTIGWLAIKGRMVSRFVREQVELSVILHDRTQPEKVVQLEKILAAQPFVSSSKIITKEEAAAQMRKDMGEEFMALLDANPLYTEIALHLKSDYVNTDSIRKIEQFVLQSNIVREVNYEHTVVDKMNATFRRIGIVLGIMALILFVAVVVIIDNTVRLAMFSNRLLIKTMQMVGATRWFIAKPFDNRAIITGLISGLVAVLGLGLLMYAAGTYFDQFSLLNDYVSFVLLAVLILLLGIIISVLSTHRAVIKYLKLKLDDLY